DLSDPYFVELEQAGMAKVIESGDGLVTVSLQVRLGSAEEEAIVRQAELFSGSLTSTSILRMILDAYTRLCEYPSMVRFSAELGQPVGACSDSPSPRLPLTSSP